MNLTSWMIHTVSRKRALGVVGNDGTPTYGSLDTIKARVEKRTVLMRTRDGKEVTVGHQMTTTVAVAFDDQFWFPSIAGETADDTSKNDQARTPLAIDTATNKPGNQFMVTVGFP